MRKVAALIPAAGSGRRMGGGTPKLFLKIGELSAIARTVSSFLNCSYTPLSHLLVIVPEGEEHRFREELMPFFEHHPQVRIITGGETRQISVQRGLAALKSEAPDTEELFVAIHDGARCLVSSQLIDRCIKFALKYQAVTAGIPAFDTLKSVSEGGRITGTINRSTTWLIQTPQVFEFELLWRAHQAYEQTEDESKAFSSTDDASLVEPLHPVQVVLGERTNIKLTTAEDYLIARSLVKKFSGSIS